IIALGQDGWDLSLLVCDDAFIVNLNEQYRNKEGPTDVLSFEQGERYETPDGMRFLAGDIVISLDALARNAQDFSVSVDEELRRLVIHGILHLSGMDHASNDPSEPMLLRQESLLAQLAGSIL
ncbi:MAG TPA: rRNA maturation RNase YbeY, partial [Spirochaetales bacterium]|nr:rRNA maturation RNase YbeY [Spirochaetales bacterium]